VAGNNGLHAPSPVALVSEVGEDSVLDLIMEDKTVRAVQSNNKCVMIESAQWMDTGRAGNLGLHAQHLAEAERGTVQDLVLGHIMGVKIAKAWPSRFIHAITIPARSLELYAGSGCPVRKIGGTVM